MSAKTALIISYYYAPSRVVGAKRFSFLAREFERLGYDVHVIAHDLKESPHGKADATLPIPGRVHRCTERLLLPLRGGGWFNRLVNRVMRYLLSPVGMEYLWARAATRKALQVARDLPAGVVIATAPPYAALIAGARVARKLGWPLILDYRDPWSAYEWPRWRRGAVTQWFARRIESRVVGRSAARVLNTPAMRDWFERTFPGLPRQRNFVIPNGFDPLPATAPPPAEGPIEIVHAGEIFTGRSLLPVLESAARLRTQFPARPIHVVTYGELPPVEWDRIRAAGLESYIDVRPRIPFAALIAKLERAHLLLAVVSDHMSYSTPYKVYDYMAAGRPILGLAPKGAALFDLLADSDAGVCLEPEDATGIDHALEKFMIGDVAIARARVERFRWSNLALQYRLAIESVSGTSASLHDRDELRPTATLLISNNAGRTNLPK